MNVQEATVKLEALVSKFQADLDELFSVLAHLGWIKRYADVYDEPGPSRLYERNLR